MTWEGQNCSHHVRGYRQSVSLDAVAHGVCQLDEVRTEPGTTSVHRVEGSRAKGRAGEPGSASQQRRKEEHMSVLQKGRER